MRRPASAACRHPHQARAHTGLADSTLEVSGYCVDRCVQFTDYHVEVIRHAFGNPPPLGAARIAIVGRTIALFPLWGLSAEAVAYSAFPVDLLCAQLFNK